MNNFLSSRDMVLTGVWCVVCDYYMDVLCYCTVVCNTHQASKGGCLNLKLYASWVVVCNS